MHARAATVKCCHFRKCACCVNHRHIQHLLELIVYFECLVLVLQGKKCWEQHNTESLPPGNSTWITGDRSEAYNAAR